MNADLDALKHIERPGYAVVLLLTPLSTDPSKSGVVITRRSTKVSTHKGQLSFPGGRLEPGESILDAALREVQEEIGIPPSDVTPIGFLPAVEALDRSSVLCVVAHTLLGPSNFMLSEDEVAYVYVVPASLLTRSSGQPFRFNMFGRWRESYRFDAIGLRIWGLTAKILHDADLTAD